jgi:hypothetical protein
MKLRCFDPRLLERFMELLGKSPEKSLLAAGHA